MPTYLIVYYARDVQRTARLDAPSAEAAKARFPAVRETLPGVDHRLETRKGTILAGVNPHNRKWKLKPRQLSLPNGEDE